MDINAIAPIMSYSNSGSPQSRATDTHIGHASLVTEEPVQIAAVEKSDLMPSDEKRYEAINRAAHSSFKDTYAVSDKKFTIFKDSQGQFITRFTNLRDGTVTYYPEPDMLAQLESTGNRQTLVEIEA